MSRNLHLILHVPKCAGRTMENHLDKHLTANQFWRPKKRTRKIPLELLGRKYDATPPGPLDEVVAISGHLFGRSIEKMFPNRTFVRSVILREPESQMLSWYNYSMMRYVTQGWKPFPFRLFVRSHAVDPVAHFLLERYLEMPWVKIASLTADEKVARLDEALSEIDRVVDISEADDLFAWHSRDLGVSADIERTNTSKQWAKETGWTTLKRDQLTAADSALLESRFAIDRYLWRRWALKQNVAFEIFKKSNFLGNELIRPFYEVRRRAARQFGWEGH